MRTTPATRQLLAMYDGIGPLVALHARIRLLTCPFPAMEELVPARGKILDLGCGTGLFSHLLALCGPDRRIEAVDISPARIAIARRAAGKRTAVTFREGDITSPGFAAGPYDAVVLSDVLYLLSRTGQEELLRRCFSLLRNDGCLFIKETDTAPRYKRLVNLLQETVSVRLLKMAHCTAFSFRSAEQYRELLSSIGFACSIQRLDRGYLHPHVALICKKRSMKHQ